MTMLMTSLLNSKCRMLWCTVALCCIVSPAIGAPLESSAPDVLTLTVDDALGLFLKRNLDLLMAQYGIEFAKGLEVTAKLFPNPILSVDGTGSTTKSLHQVGALSGRVDQLFELAGKRRYRMESARFGTQSAEAAFTDAVRTWGFSVEEASCRVLLCRVKAEHRKVNSTDV